MRVVNGSLLVCLSTFTYCIYPRDKTKSMFPKEITNRVESIEATSLGGGLYSPPCQCLWHHHSIGMTDPRDTDMSVSLVSSQVTGP